MESASAIKLYEDLRPDLGQAPSLHIAQSFDAMQRDIVTELRTRFATRQDLLELEVRLVARFAALELSLIDRINAGDSKLEDRITAWYTKLEEHIHAVECKLEEHIHAVECRLEEQIHAVESRLEEQIHAVEGRLEEQIHAVEGRLDARITELDFSMRDRIAVSEAATRADIGHLRSQLHRLEHRQTWMFATLLLAILLSNREALQLLAQLLHLLR